MSRSNDQTRLQQIYEDHSAFLLFYLKKLKVSAEDADDILQESFLRFFHHMAKVEPGKERGFLVTTAKNIVIDRFRKMKTQKTIAMGEASYEPSQALWISDPHRDWELEALGQVVDELSQEKGGEIFRLFYRDGLSLQEIARKYDQPLGTIASKISRFRSRFQNIIRERLENSRYRI
ncbi:MAG: RNA polymerase sigma factor [Oligoflexus sp.]